MSEVTQILQAIEAGDPKAASELLPLVYDELCKLAAARLADEKRMCSRGASSYCTFVIRR
jgi:DNA-binding GntR family transcriptional regulator